MLMPAAGVEQQDKNNQQLRDVSEVDVTWRRRWWGSLRHPITKDGGFGLV